MPHFFNFFTPLYLVLFLLISIILPGVFIWAGLKVLGRDRGILRCGTANFAAFTITMVISVLLLYAPLIVLLLIAFIVYLYFMKSLLDISFIEAFAATVIAVAILIAVAFVLLIIFGVRLLFTLTM